MERINIVLFLVTICCCSVIVRSERRCDPRNCLATTGEVCNGHGTCDCGTCRCNGSFHGPTCEECPTCKSPCEIYSGCVSCKIFSTGLMGFMECLDLCDRIAMFHPVEKEDFPVLGKDEGMDECQRINEMDCGEMFKISGMAGGARNLFVQTEMDCDIDVASVWESTTQVQTVAERTTTPKRTTTPTPTTTPKRTTAPKPTTTPNPTTTTKPTTTSKVTTTSKPTSAPKRTTVPKRTTSGKKTNDDKGAIVEVDENKQGSDDENDATKYGPPEVADAVSGSSDDSDSNNGSRGSMDFKVSAVLCLCTFLMAVL